MSLKLIRGLALGLSALILAHAPEGRAQDADTSNPLSMGNVLHLGVARICVPVMQEGESVEATATAIGFQPMSAELAVQMGSAPNIQWFMYPTDALIFMVSRNEEVEGTPCTIAAIMKQADAGDAYGMVSIWVAAQSPPYSLVASPDKTSQDRVWKWQREINSTLQVLELTQTLGGDDMAIGVLRLGLLPLPK